MPSEEFRIGDRVICIGDADGNPMVNGAIGTVIGFWSSDICSVEYDEDIGGHSLGGKCEDGYGWNTNIRYLQHYEGSPEPLAPPMSYSEVMG